MNQNSRYLIPIHPYRIVDFVELPPVLMAPDNRCTCSQDDHCPLRKTGDQERCTLEELRRIDSEAMSRRAWQSGGDW